MAADEFKAAYIDTCEAKNVKPREELINALNVAAAHGADTVERVPLNGNSKTMFTDRMEDKDVAALVETILSGAVVLQTVDLSYNHISDKGAEHIATMLKDTETYTCTVEQLDLRGNSIGVAGCRSIAKAMATNVSVRTLNLNGNPISNDGGMTVAEMLYSNAVLQSLDIGNCDIGTETLIALATVLSSNSTLQHINIENARVFSRQEDSTYHMCRMLQANGTLAALNLAKHKIGDFGAALVAEHLAENRSLFSLSLPSNSIAGPGGKALAKLLQRGSVLEELDLDNNRVGNEGAVELAEAIRVNKTLRSLTLRNNSIEDEGLAAIASALEEAGGIMRLSLWGNNFGRKSKEAFHSLFEGRLKYMPIEIDFKSYLVDGEVHLAKVSP